MATLYTVQTAAGILHAALTLDEEPPCSAFDPLELEWAIEEDGICSTSMTGQGHCRGRRRRGG